MTSVFLIFPHQLFKDISLLKQVECVYLIEEYLYFSQYKFHKQKLVLHRASMKFYENYLQEQDINVKYIQSTNKQQSEDSFFVTIRISDRNIMVIGTT